MSATRSLDLGAAERLQVSARPLLGRLALACLIAYCVIGAYLVIAGSMKMLPNPNENTYPESPTLYAAVEGVRAGHIYLSPDAPPHPLQPYGPLFYLVNFAIVRASHLDFETLRTRLRWLSFASFLLSGLAAALILRKFKAPMYACALAALMLVGQHYFIEWNVSARPDMLCLLLMLLCLYFAAGTEQLPTSSYIVSGVFGAMAFLVKQPGLAAPLAVLAMLLLRKSLRQAAWFALAAALPVTLVFGTLLVRGEPVLQQLTAVGRGYWSIPGGGEFLGKVLVDIRVLVPMGIAALGFRCAFRGNGGSQAIAIFAPLSLAVAFAGLPQAGADFNTFLPGLAGCALLLPFAIDGLQEQAARSRAWILAPVMLVLLWCAWTARVHERPFLFMHFAPQAEDRYAALQPFHILSDRPIFTLHGRDPEPLDPFLMHSMELSGHWDPAPMAESVQRGDYDLIILACEAMSYKVCHFRGVAYFSPAVVQAVNQNYAVLCATFSERVLVPRSREVSATPEMLASVFNQRCGVNTRGRAPSLKFPSDLR